MRIIISLTLTLLGFSNIMSGQTISLTQHGNNSFCYSGIDSFLVSWSNIPAGSNIVFYQSTNPNFNPYAGQGDSIGFIHIDNSNTSNGQPITSTCPRILGIFIDACNDNGRSEPANEYILMTSGKGFKVSNLQIDIPNNTDINFGTNPCTFATPNAATMNLFYQQSCNAANILPAGQADSIPPDALVIVFTGNGVDFAYNFNELCNTGQKVYILQSSCTHSPTSGSFANNAPNQTLCVSSYRTTTIYNRNCTDKLAYDRCGLPVFDNANPNAGDGDYVIHLDNTDTSSVANGGVLNNTTNKCNGVILDSVVGAKYIAYTVPNGQNGNPLNFCNTGTHYIKAITHPNGSQPISNTLNFILNCPAAFSLGNDTSYCGTFSRVLSTGNAATNWFKDGNLFATAASVTVTQTGSYAASVTTSCGTFADTINISAGANLNFSFGGNTTICAGGTATLDASTNYDTYQWNTGQSTHSITITQPGTYTVTVTKNGCSGTDSIKVVQIQKPNAFNLGRDTAICAASFSLSLSAGSNPSANWTKDNVAFANTTNVTVTQPGRYIASVTNGCGTVSDTINITQTSAFSFSFGGNTTICAGGTATLDASTNYDTYQWNTGQSTHSITIAQPGTYTVTVTKNGCSGTDSIKVVQIQKPNAFNLGRDTAICAASFSLSLLAGSNPSANWTKDNIVFANTTNVTVTQPGRYIASVTNGCGTVSDTINISLSTITKPNIGDTITKCQNVWLTLNAGAGYDSYLWNTNEQTQSIQVLNEGKYIVTVSKNNCSISDTVFIREVLPPKAFELGNDTSFCGNFSLILQAISSTTRWNNNFTGSQLTVNTRGTYIALDSNTCGKFADTIHIVQHVVPQPDLGEDLVFCDSTVLSIGNIDFNSILWSTLDTTPEITVNQSGLYTVVVRNQFCSGKDSIQVTHDCPFNVYLPSAFSPNLDSYNDFLFPLSDIKGITILNFSVYNRWGELLFYKTDFQANDKTQGWDGNYKGTPCDVDDYVYTMEVVSVPGEKKHYKGMFSLLR